MKPEEIQKALSKMPPETVRRVLPHDFITNYIQGYLSDMATMMKSFQAILTFPTTGRDLPQKIMQRMHQQFSQDLNAVMKKTNSEVSYLLSAVKGGKVLQSNIMLNVLSDQAFPFCVLNRWEFEVSQHNFVPCYVMLWAQQASKEESIQVWLQLNPVKSEDLDRLPADRIISEKKIIRKPTGQADFKEFGVIVSVMLHDIPTEAEASLQGKTLSEMLRELKDLREKLVRQKGQRGNFLHFVWTADSQRLPQYVQISGFELDS